MSATQMTSPCVGESPALRAVLDIALTIAPRECTVVLTGESGTGKEMLARVIHQHSRRADRPFIPVDCSNLSGELFASQLFGHVKGAFTGADRDSIGFIRAAEGGTLFLDEVGELPLGMQARLLRVLQERRVTPLGSTTSHPVDIRVICATNCDLEQMVRQGTFRSDLYYRLNVVSLHLPPLRDRREDILALAEHFLHQQARLYGESDKTLDQEAGQLLLRYPWPGNVRQLANAMERAYAVTSGPVISPQALPREIVEQDGCGALSPLPTLADATRELIMRALKYTQGRKMAAADLLQVEHRRLNRLIRNLQVRV